MGVAMLAVLVAHNQTNWQSVYITVFREVAAVASNWVVSFLCKTATCAWRCGVDGPSTSQIQETHNIYIYIHKKQLSWKHVCPTFNTA